MARLAGVDIPNEKRIEIALTYIFGVGRTPWKRLPRPVLTRTSARWRSYRIMLVTLRDYLELTTDRG